MSTTTTTIHEQRARTLLYELWYSYAEKLIERIITTVELDEKQIEALRRVSLRPNDFIVCIEGDMEEGGDEE
jgi:hypothetical protein